MGEIRKCPGCEKHLEYPDGPNECPYCGYEIDDWWKSRRRGLATKLGVDEDELE